MTSTVETIANRFWAEARLPDTYPRDLEQAVALVLPVAIVKLPSLTTTDVVHWLRSHGIDAQVDSLSKELMGCIVANRGHGIVFVRGGDPSDEQRLTIAHEAAHFLRHYLLPRESVIEALGSAIVEVLDGERDASARERIAGVLAGVRVGAHVHLLARPGASTSRVNQAEDEADELAIELVAPRSKLTAFLRTRHVQTRPRSEQLRALSMHFGLPEVAFSKMVGADRPAPFLVEAVSAIKERSE